MTEEEEPLISTKPYYRPSAQLSTLEQILELIGVGRAQYLYWSMISLAAYSEYSGLVVISLISPILRCTWELSLTFEAVINCSVFLFYAMSSLVFGKLSDVYGRRAVLIITMALIFLSSLFSAVARDKYQFLASRCMVGAAIGACIGPIISYGPETVQTKYRAVGPTFFAVFGVIATFGVSCLAWLLLNRVGWRLFIVINTLPIVPMLYLLSRLPESPRYLSVSGQHAKARAALIRIACMNSVKLPDFTVRVYERQELGSIGMILQPPYLKNTVLLSVLYFANIAMEFGLMIFVPLAITSGFFGGTPVIHECRSVVVYNNVTGNAEYVENLPYVTQDSLLKIMMTSLWPILGAVIAYVTAIRCGRLAPARVIAGLLTLSTTGLYFAFNSTVLTIFLTWIRVLECGANTVLWIIIPEVTPTMVRTTSTGFICFWGKLGGVVSTGLVYGLFYLSKYAVVSMFVVMGGISVVGYIIFDNYEKGQLAQDCAVEDMIGDEES